MAYEDRIKIDRCGSLSPVLPIHTRKGDTHVVSALRVTNNGKNPADVKAR